jgi:hypothetical protein
MAEALKYIWRLQQRQPNHNTLTGTLAVKMSQRQQEGRGCSINQRNGPCYKRVSSKAGFRVFFEGICDRRECEGLGHLPQHQRTLKTTTAANAPSSNGDERVF